MGRRSFFASASLLASTLLTGGFTLRAQQAATSLPSFEIASIKPDHSNADAMTIHTEPDRFIGANVNARFLIEFAFNLQRFQLSGGPGWINSENFDIDAKQDDREAAALQTRPASESLTQMRLMMQSLLADRFHLKVTHDTKQVTIYTLSVGKSGLKISETPHAPASAVSGPPRQKGVYLAGPGHFVVKDSSISSFAAAISRQPEINTLVVDHTGLDAHYDFELQWTPADPIPTAATSNANPAAIDMAGPSLFTALEEQLGLKLAPSKGPMETVEIDSIEEPAAN
jgi:uncharacterized protein (TIGR03435 family)